MILAIIDLSAGRALRAFLVALGVGLVVDVRWLSGTGRPSATTTPACRARGSLGAAAVRGGSSAARRWLLGAVCRVVGSAAAGAVRRLRAWPIGLLLGRSRSAGSAACDVASAHSAFAALLLFWPIVAAVLVFRHGVDMAKLKDRFVPDQTIATTKETIEWVREQMPLGPKS